MYVSHPIQILMPPFLEAPATKNGGYRSPICLFPLPFLDGAIRAVFLRSVPKMVPPQNFGSMLLNLHHHCSE
jgi:hypothetical protein